MLKRSVIILAFTALALTGCKKAKEVAAKASYKDRAAALAAKYGPKLGELSKHLPAAAAAAKGLPVNVPGADKLGALLAENESSVKEAQELLAKLPEKVGNESPEQAEKDLAEAEKILQKDIETAEKDEKEEAAILAAAKAAAPAGSAK